MKAIKIAILKLVFLLIVLIGTIAAYFVFTYEKTEDRRRASVRPHFRLLP